MEANYLSLEEMQALLKAIDRETAVLGKRDYAWILAHLTSGLRGDELNCLRWRDLEVDERSMQARARRLNPERPNAPVPMEVVEAIRELSKVRDDLDGAAAGNLASGDVYLRTSVQYLQPGYAGQGGRLGPLSPNQPQDYAPTPETLCILGRVGR